MRARMAHDYRQRCAPALISRTPPHTPHRADQARSARGDLTVPFEVLHRALVFLRLGARFESAEISAPARFRIGFS